MELMFELHRKLLAELMEWGLSKDLSSVVTFIVFVMALFFITWTVAIISKRVFVYLVERLAKRTDVQFDDYLLHNKSIAYLSRFIPFLIVYKSIPVLFYSWPAYIGNANLVAECYFALWSVWLFRSFLYTFRDWLRTKDAFKDKPLDSFIQVITVVSYVIAAAVIFSLITGKSITVFVTAMGAASAVFLLIFKDTILGFVASIQVSANDMVRIGDWITMDKYGADGFVTEINLATVKVQNFDKTITTIPTYFLISDSFKNWRGMQSSGGRRIKRSLRVKVASVRFLTDEDIQRFSKVELIKEYLATRLSEIAAHNERLGVDVSIPVNGRRLTNIGVYREYINSYIRKNEHLHQGMIMMTRQLEPTTEGVPIELYVFTNDVRWVNYEHIMADIFDHLMAIVSYFDLEIFELPSSGDMRALVGYKTGNKVAI